MKRFRILCSKALPGRYASFEFLEVVIQAEDEEEAKFKALSAIEEYIAKNDLKEFGEVEFILSEFQNVATWILGEDNKVASKAESHEEF